MKLKLIDRDILIRTATVRTALPAGKLCPSAFFFPFYGNRNALVDNRIGVKQ